MLRLQFKRPSLAMVVALLAVTIALGGTAVAVAPTAVNIVDKTTPANAAKVAANGYQYTYVVAATGVAQAAPKTPFFFSAISFTDSQQTAQMSATNAVLAISGMEVANGTGSGTTVTLYQYPLATASTPCSTNTSSGSPRFLGQVAVPAGQTAERNLTTPLVLKPLSSGPYYCLITFASGASGSGFYTNYNGYVVSGTFGPAAGAAGLQDGPGAGTPVTRPRTAGH